MPSSQKSRWVLTASVIRAKPKLSCVRMQEQAFLFWQYENETLRRIAQIWLISGLRLQSRSFSGNQARDLPQVLEARPSWDSTDKWLPTNLRELGTHRWAPIQHSASFHMWRNGCMARFRDRPEVTELDLGPALSCPAWFLVYPHLSHHQWQIYFLALNLCLWSSWQGEITLNQTENRLSS